MNAIHNTVLYEQHGAAWNGAHGISVYFPETPDEYDPRYDGISNWLVFSASNHWDEWLRDYFNLPQWATILFMPVIEE
jgi:hypothetical protein